MIKGHESGGNLHSMVDNDEIEIECQNNGPEERGEHGPAGEGSLGHTYVLKYLTFLVLSFIVVCDKVHRANDIAHSTDKVGKCEKSDDFLSSSAHVFQHEESDYYEDGSEAGEPAGDNGHVAGNRTILDTDIRIRTIARRWTLRRVSGGSDFFNRLHLALKIVIGY